MISIELLLTGEPGYPVAAVERGKKVIVASNQDFLVADHDSTRFSLVPCVTLIPDEISESWYEGQVRVTLKEGSMQPSSPHRYASELISGFRIDIWHQTTVFLCSTYPFHLHRLWS